MSRQPYEEHEGLKAWARFYQVLGVVAGGILFVFGVNDLRRAPTELQFVFFVESLLLGALAIVTGFASGALYRALYRIEGHQRYAESTLRDIERRLSGDHSSQRAHTLTKLATGSPPPSNIPTESTSDKPKRNTGKTARIEWVNNAKYCSACATKLTGVQPGGLCPGCGATIK